MKKRSIQLIIFSVFTLLGISCADYLDKGPDEDLTLEQVFSQRNYAEAFLTSAYYNLPWEMNFSNDWGENPFVGAADEQDQPYTNSFCNWMNDGAWTPDNVLCDIWNMTYRGIRKVNIFLENVHKVPMNNEKDRAVWRGEATFLRAFFHFQLLRIYGPMNNIDRAYASDDDFTPLLKRIPLEQCADFIIKDCDAAAELLPMTVTSDKYGRATKAVAMALKSRLLLYMASPLWNGNPDYASFTNKQGELLFPAENTDRWRIAAEYMKVCIDSLEAAGYGLYRAPSNDPLENYRDLFLVTHNKEIIFARNMGRFAQIEQVSAPVGMSGWSGLCPTQEMVDAYEMEDGSTPILGYNADGSPIVNHESGYVEDGFAENAHPKNYYPKRVLNMYANREPRFYASINYNNCMWRGRRINFFLGGVDGRKGGPDYTTTGYLMRKFLDEKGVDIVNGKYTNKTWIYFRMGELYLNYAEALNEWRGPVADVYTYVNQVRARSGMKALPDGLGQKEMQKRIHHERRVELAFETHRYFDCHRWKTAEETDNKPIHGMDITARDNSFYTRTVVEKRKFVAPKHYLWPLPQNEINKDPLNYVQNPGWVISVE